MNTTTDDKSVLGFPGTKSEADITVLVRHHGSFVLATCRRLLGSRHLHLDDAVQTVFFLLMKKSQSIRDSQAVVGWLHTTARGVCAHIRREEGRRIRRERVAASLQAKETLPPCETQVRDHLDLALSNLSGAQREAVMRHFLEGKSQALVATELGISEGAVKKRVADGIDKLRRFYARRSIQVTALALVSVMTAESATANSPIVLATFAGNALPNQSTAQLLHGVIKSMLIKKVIATVLAVAACISVTSVALISAETSVEAKTHTSTQDPEAFSKTVSFNAHVGNSLFDVMDVISGSVGLNIIADPSALTPAPNCAKPRGNLQVKEMLVAIEAANDLAHTMVNDICVIHRRGIVPTCQPDSFPQDLNMHIDIDGRKSMTGLELLETSKYTVDDELRKQLGSVKVDNNLRLADALSQLTSRMRRATWTIRNNVIVISKVQTKSK
jgi:RNA polymerase sigma factor (sigma-70 family)